MTVTIEPISMSHADRVQELASQPEVQATTVLPSPYPSDGARTFIEETLSAEFSDKRHVFVVKVGDEIAGLCGLHGEGRDDGEAELGFWLGREFWGKGYTSDAVWQLLHIAFKEKQLERLTAGALLTNRASTRVLEKVGFHLTEVRADPESKWSTQKVAYFILRREMWEVGLGI